MTAIVVVGAQWGDEGKGKVTDVLAPDAKLHVQYAGGGNPGQTIVAEGERLVFDLLPAGAIKHGMSSVLAHGMAIDPVMLLSELSRLEEHGVGADAIFVCRRAHVILPHHHLLDEHRKEGEGASGMPRRGIGPAYADKLARRGVQVGDLVLGERLADKVKESLDGWSSTLSSLGARVPAVSEIVDRYAGLGDKLAKRMVDGSRHVREAIARPDNVILEAPLGTMVDLDLGSYPFVVSASTVAGGAAPGVGIPPRAIDRVVGVAKVYSTRAGRGPFPAEVTGDLAAHLLEKGQEYGATGRPRRVGMLDLAALRYAARVNGFDTLVVTKLDVLSGLSEIPVCMGYELDGRVLEEPPFEGLSRATPLVEMQPGFSENIDGCRTWDELPANARRLLELVEATTGVPVGMVGVGPDKSATIVRRSPFA
jgi:adenylosuccinate synthase